MKISWRFVVLVLFLLLVEVLWRRAAAQTVTLPTEVARFYLERHELAKVYEEQIDIKQQIIDNLLAQKEIIGKVIVTYIDDEKLYKDALALKDQTIALKDDTIKFLKREVRRQKVQKILVVAGTVVIIILLI